MGCPIFGEQILFFVPDAAKPNIWNSVWRCTLVFCATFWFKTKSGERKYDYHAAISSVRTNIYNYGLSSVRRTHFIFRSRCRRVEHLEQRFFWFKTKSGVRKMHHLNLPLKTLNNAYIAQTVPSPQTSMNVLALTPQNKEIFIFHSITMDGILHAIIKNLEMPARHCALEDSWPLPCRARLLLHRHATIWLPSDCAHVHRAENSCDH